MKRAPGTAIHGRRFHVLIAAGLVLAGLVVPAPFSAATAQKGTGLELLGRLDLGEFADETTIDKPQVVGIDADRRRLYIVTGTSGSLRRLLEYDLDGGDVPTLLRASEPILPTTVLASPIGARLDPPRNRALFLGAGQDASGQRSVLIVNLEDLTHTEWNLTERVPGFVAMGLTYDPERDRVYLVGSFEGNVNATLAFTVLGTNSPGAAVVALDGQTGALVWAQGLSGCDRPMFKANAGSLIALSELRPMLYMFCAAGSTFYQPSGQGGLMRLDLADEEGTSGVADFPLEFFPISGEYAGDVFKAGTAAFDAARERFFAQSLSSRTHGAWVFDGLQNSWVGFIASADDWNQFAGVDPASGKHYMAGGDYTPGSDTPAFSYLNVSSAGATPVPQGQLFGPVRAPSHLGTLVQAYPASDVVVDSATRRIFLGVAWDQPGHEEDEFATSAAGWIVMRDHTPPLTPLPPLDLDALTNPLELDEAHLEFSSNTSGFGAEYAAVGGWENVYSRATVPLFPTLTEFVPPNPANIQYGTRGATVAVANAVGIAPGASSASAIASQPDDSSQKDAANQTQDVGSDDETLEFSHVTCLDGIGEPVTTAEGAPDDPTYAVVTCDLENLETVAHTHFSDQTGAGGVGVGSASFDGRTYRDPERGVVSESTAVAEGIVFGDVEVGGVVIDRVTTTVTTAANGLDGTSYARWERVVEGARTIDSFGVASESQSCRTVIESGEEPVHEGDCQGIEEQANRVLQNRFRMRFPIPEVLATPGGAFASVQETETDYLNGLTTNDDLRRSIPGLEVTTFMDGPEKGRLIVQMAAIRSDSTFIRSPKPVFTPIEFRPEIPPAPVVGPVDPVDPPLVDDPVAVPAPIDAGSEPLPDDDAPPMVAISHEERLVGAFGWLPAVRSLRQGLLVGALYLLLALPVAEAARRRRLLHVLMDDRTSPNAPRS